jgi:dolichyl-phosphate beta-glucosyltransferase
MAQVSVILPVYNEAKCIEKTLSSVLLFSQEKPNYDFIFVNDGSTDKTKDILERNLALKKASNVNLISYELNQGKGYAVKLGVSYAQGDYICYIDSDLAYALEHLELVIEKLECFDMVIGCRSLAANHFQTSRSVRMIAGKIFNILSRYILDLPFTDMQAGIKGFKNNVAKELFQRQQITGFSFDVELVYIAYRKGYDIGEIPAVSVVMFLDLLRIKYNDKIGRYK